MFWPGGQTTNNGVEVTTFSTLWLTHDCEMTIATLVDWVVPGRSYSSTEQVKDYLVLIVVTGMILTIVVCSHRSSVRSLKFQHV